MVDAPELDQFLVAPKAEALAAVVAQVNPDAVLVTSSAEGKDCLLYTSPSPRDRTRYRMPSSA